MAVCVRGVVSCAPGWLLHVVQAAQLLWAPCQAVEVSVARWHVSAPVCVYVWVCVSGQAGGRWVVVQCRA